MTRNEEEIEAGELLAERAAKARLGLELSPDLLQKLKSLLLRLGWTNMKLQRRETLLRSVERVAKLVQDKLGGTHHTIEPIILKRKGQKPVRFAKVDSHVQAHPLVQGFPIENALRHLANDPNNHPTIRELAKVAVTGGKNGDASNVPTALWALHDELHEKKHPAKDWYNWMSAADKIGLDKHTHTALREYGEARRSREARWNGHTGDEFMYTPEGHAGVMARAIGDKYSMWWHPLNQVKDKIKQLSPSSSDEDIEESIRRHAHRALGVWRNQPDMGTPDPTTEEELKQRDLKPGKKFNDKGFAVDTPLLNEKATRYRRLLRRLARKNTPLPEGWIAPDGTVHLIPQGGYTHAYVAKQLFPEWKDSPPDDAENAAYSAGYVHLGRVPTADSIHLHHPNREFTGLQIEAVKKLAAEHNVTGGVTLDGKRQSRSLKLQRLRRMLNRIRYALGEGKSSKHLSGEDMFSHEYDGGVANIIPRNEGKTLHVDYVGPKGASPGEAAHFNTLGPSKLRDMAKRLREMYPNSQFITGIRPTGKRVMRDITKLSRINSSNTEGLKYARSTPESIKKLEQAVLHSPNNPTLIHALADEYEENGRGNEAEMLRNPEFHHLVKDLTEREAGFGANHNAGERLNFSAATATPNPMLLAALAARMSKKRPVTASIISHGNDGPRDSLSVMRRGWYLNDASSVPLKGADFARHNNAPTPGRPARIAVRIGMPQHPMHYLNFSRDMTPEEADQTEQSLRAEGLHGHEDHEAPDAMIDVRKALGESEHKPVHMMGRSREGHHDLRRYQMVAGDFLQALQRIRSSDQRTVRKSMEEIAAKLGAKPASTVDALHDSPAYSVPGVAMAIYSNLSPEKIHALAAWGALTQNTPGNAVFHVRPDGPDMLHRFRMQGSGHELRARLDKAGLDSRILVPHKTGFDVMIPDKGGLLRNQVKGFTDQQKTELQTSRGHFKMIGSSDQARAREMFRDAITKQEQGPVRKSEGADNSPPPSIPQGPPAGPGAGADLPSQPVHRASRIRRIMERLKRV